MTTIKCKRGHSPLQPATCSLCRGLTPQRRWASPPPRPCVHLGEETGDTRVKLNCTKTPPVQIQTRSCAVHGVCTEATVARDTQCCRFCADKELAGAWTEETKPPSGATIIDHGAGGIGDGLLGLLAIAKLKADNPAEHIHYRVSPTASPFVALFHGYDTLGRSVKSHSEAALPGGVRQLNVGSARENQLCFPVPRWERYAENAGTTGYLVPPLRDHDAIRKLGGDTTRCVILCPYSTDRMREWSIQHWQTMENLLLRAGYQVRLLHDRQKSEFRSPKIVGDSAHIAGAILNAVAVIGSDSGMAHLSGILGVPTIVLGGSTPVENIFGAYPRVTCIQGELDCSGCCGGKPLTDRCLASCSNLQSITPAQVLASLDPCISDSQRLISAKPVEPKRVSRLDSSNLAVGAPVSRFNGSILPWGNGYLLAFRVGTYDPTRWGPSQIWLAMLDAACRPTGEAKRLDLPHPACRYSQEDPRLFLCRQQLHVSFTGIPALGQTGPQNQLYARLGDDLSVEEVFHVDLPNRQVMEKNWVFFDSAGELHCVYETRPEHVIFRLDGDQVVEEWRTPGPPQWSGGLMRGGASPVWHKDHWYHWFHGRSDGIPSPNRVTYEVGCLKFEDKPPFRVVACTPEPLLVGKPEHDNRHSANVVFCCGAVVSNGSWLTSIGFADTWLEILKWDETGVEGAMRDVLRPKMVELPLLVG